MIMVCVIYFEMTNVGLNHFMLVGVSVLGGGDVMLFSMLRVLGGGELVSTIF